jgi:hypothetical protein
VFQLHSKQVFFSCGSALRIRAVSRTHGLPGLLPPSSRSHRARQCSPFSTARCLLSRHRCTLRQFMPGAALGLPPDIWCHRPERDDELSFPSTSQPRLRSSGTLQILPRHPWFRCHDVPINLKLLFPSSYIYPTAISSLHLDFLDPPCACLDTLQFEALQLHSRSNIWSRKAVRPSLLIPILFA